MKIKHSLSFSIKPQITVFIIVSVVCVLIRTLQMFSFIDAETGFITGGAFLNFLLNAVIIASFLYFAVGSYLVKDAKKIDIHSIKSPLTASLTFLFAFSFIHDFANSISLSYDALTVTPAQGGMQALMGSGFLPVVLQSVFALFSTIYFVIVAFDYLKGNNKASKFKILALFPVGWAATRLVHRFIKQISFIEISDLFLELVMIAFMVLFFMAFAQVNSDVYSEGFAWRINGFGLSAGLIALTLSIARLVFTVTKGSESINPEYPFYFSDLCFAAFVIGIVIDIRSKLFSDNEKALASEDISKVE